MPIPVSYMVVGSITGAGGAIPEDKTVYITNTTKDVHKSTTTDSNGAYRYDIQNFTTGEEGDSYNITCEYDAESAVHTFVLDLAQPFRVANLFLTQFITTYKVDTLLDKTISTTNLFDIEMINMYYISNLVDTLTQKLESTNLESDSILMKQEDISNMIDILADKGVSMDSEVDAILYKRELRQYLVDALLYQKNNYTLHELDTLAIGYAVAKLEYDTFISIPDISLSEFFDSLLLKMEERGVEIDTILYELGIKKDILIDTIIMKYREDIYLFDTLIKKYVDKSYEADTLTHKFNIGENLEVDTLLEKQFDTSIMFDVTPESVRTDKMYLDTLLTTQFVRQTLIDILLSKRKLDTHKLDTFVSSIEINSIDYDTLLYATEFERVEYIDTLLTKFVDKGVELDTILHKFDIKKSILLDVVIMKYVTTTHQLDSIIMKYVDKHQEIDTITMKNRIIKTVLSDALLYKTIGKCMEYDLRLEQLSQYKTHYYDLLSYGGTSEGGMFDIRLGKNLVSWIIDTCAQWNLGSYISNTRCLDGDLILNRC